jgi:Asp/Glu/hydantoin racemase
MSERIPASDSVPALSGVARGGKRLYGYAIGILMLEARFPRIPGDMGNAHTFPFPVLYHVVEGASPTRVVRAPDDALVGPFLDAARELERAGVRAITTNCGFLIRYQAILAGAVGVPVFTSSLLQVPLALRMLAPGQSVGVITIDSKALTWEQMAQAGITPEMPVHVAGLEREEHFTDAILNDRLELDPEVSAREHEVVARRLVREHPEIGAIVLECTNMPPYAHRIQAATGLPVFDIVTMTNWIHDSLIRRRFEGHL